MVFIKNTSAKNLLKAISNNMVSVKDVKVESKDNDEVKTITADQFKTDLEFYLESGVFADTLDFKYGIYGNELTVKIGYMSNFCNNCITVNLVINDGVNAADLEKVLRKVED